MTTNPQVWSYDQNGFRTLAIGESGGDECSIICCPNCYSEGGDYGLSFNYKWDDVRKGWDVWAGCATCAHVETHPFIETD